MCYSVIYLFNSDINWGGAIGITHINDIFFIYDFTKSPQHHNHIFMDVFDLNSIEFESFDILIVVNEFNIVWFDYLQSYLMGRDEFWKFNHS